MKLQTLFLVGALMLSACNESEPVTKAADDSADIDYTAENAAAWANYMAQVSALLRNDASTLYDAWTSDGYADRFKALAPFECVEQIIDGCADIANEVGTAKIGDPFNLYVSGNVKRALYAVESWYSWHSREDYANNILSIRNSYFGSLDGSVSPNSLSAMIDSAVDAEVVAAISAAESAILAIPQPFRSNINSAESRAAMVACADLEEILSGQLKSAVRTLNETQLRAIADNFVDVVVLPTYAELKSRNDALHQSIVTFKNAPSDAAFAAACSAWLEAREPWEKSEAFLFGPVDALGLDPNMDSWPLDQDAIVQILTSGNYDDLNWTDGDDDDRIEAVQSVRGFHTLEFLLFKNGKPRTVK